MKTGIRASFIPSPKIPPYASKFKKEYLYIRGLNQDLKYFLYSSDDINKGLFETKSSNRIKYNMKRFLRAQEKGKIKDISNLMFQINDIQNFINLNYSFDLYKMRYDAFCEDSYCNDYNDYVSDDSDDDGDGEYLVDGKPYPGFIEIYDIFKMIFNQLKYEDYDSSDDDSDSDCDSDREELDFSYTDSDLEDFCNHLKSFIS